MSAMRAQYKIMFKNDPSSDRLATNMRDCVKWLKEDGPSRCVVLLTTCHLGEEDEHHGWRSGEEVIDRGIDAWLTDSANTERSGASSAAVTGSDL